jgi:tRNA wybutosine-synthesizing protein 3
MTFNFNNSKKMALKKGDKSSIQGIDKPILKLCEKINNSNTYFTTSSCSGRIILIKDQEKKAPGLFTFRSHKKTTFKELKEALNKLIENKVQGTVLFKQEPCLVVVSCIDKDSQWELFSAARNNGWKKSGILSINKKRLLELMASENMSFPIYKDEKILVNDEFLKIVLEKANSNLEKGWKKIERLKKLI